MGLAQFQLEQKAFAALKAVYDEAVRADALFKEAGLETPLPLRRLFGGEDSANGKKEALPAPPPLVEPPRPHGTGSNWMWLENSRLTALTTAKCILREKGIAIPVKTLVEEISSRLGEGVSPNSLYNSGLRLAKGKVISQTKKGWELKDKTVAPVSWEGHAWGTLECFSDFEIATFRRNCVVHLLSHVDSLSSREILSQLERLDQFKAGGTSREGTRADVAALYKSGLIKRSATDKHKWCRA